MSRRSGRPMSTMVATAALAWSAGVARRGRVGPIEERVFRAANDAPDRLHIPVWTVMQAGSLADAYAAAAMIWWRGDRRGARIAATAGTALWAGVKVVKPLVGRGRPGHHLDEVTVRGQAQSGLGYPSGHAAVSLAMAMAVAHERPVAERAVAVGIAAVTGWGRMYVGAHLPLDLVGGFAIGALSGQLTELLMGRRRLTAP